MNHSPHHICLYGWSLTDTHTLSLILYTHIYIYLTDFLSRALALFQASSTRHLYPGHCGHTDTFSHTHTHSLTHTLTHTHTHTHTHCINDRCRRQHGSGRCDSPQQQWLMLFKASPSKLGLLFGNGYGFIQYCGGVHLIEQQR